MNYRMLDKNELLNKNDQYSFKLSDGTFAQWYRLPDRLDGKLVSVFNGLLFRREVANSIVL